jgi:Reverse transcriptase (RNA-dependent DNA polymerase)
VIHRPTDGGAVRAMVSELRRPSGEARWLTELDPRTAAAYAELVRRHTSRIEASLDAGVIANRVGARGTLSPVSISRRAWRRRLGRVIRPGLQVAFIASDVARCYASIAPDAVGSSLAACCADGFDELLELLARIATAGTPGLPIGPEPSAVLANAVLAVADRSAREAGAQILRWVDDVVLIAPDRRAVVRAFDAWVRGLRQVGLQPNGEKTRLWPTTEDAATALGFVSPSGA